MVQNRITRLNIRKAPIRTLERLNLCFHMMFSPVVLFSIKFCIIISFLARISRMTLFSYCLLNPSIRIQETRNPAESANPLFISIFATAPTDKKSSPGIPDAAHFNRRPTQRTADFFLSLFHCKAIDVFVRLCQPNEMSASVGACPRFNTYFFSLTADTRRETQTLLPIFSPSTRK